MIVLTLCALTFALTTATPNDQTQIEKYADDRFKKYRLEVPGKEPITIIETAPADNAHNEWVDISVNLGRGKDDIEIKNSMTDIIHDHGSNGDRPRCFGPSCQEGFIDDLGPQGNLEEFIADYPAKQKDFRDFSSDRIQAITALAEKLKKEKFNADRYYGPPSPSNMGPEEYQEEAEEDNSGKVYSSWNRLKVKQHKHPFDDKDGWVTMEPVAWSTSKISKWKPNVKKHKPTWTDSDDRFSNEDKYSGYQGMGNTQSQNYPSKRPPMTRPAYINNKLHVTSSTANWDSELPSKPSWNKPDSYYSYPSAWNPDEGRKPHKPHCDDEEHHQHSNRPSDDTLYYGMPDSVVTDNRPSYFPYEYEALKRPVRRPTQVVYAGTPDVDSERGSRPFGDGQWVLLSTTKGYRNKKRQRSLSTNEEHINQDIMNPPTITSHQAVALTVLPVDDDHTNMTTSHGGLLEVERSFQTVEESKRDMDRKNDLRPDESTATSNHRPSYNRVVRRKVFANVAPDSTSVLAAVGAGMVPATMAMVVPMMLGKRRRRDITRISDGEPIDHMFYKYE